jgi:membrane protease YdiL (CAAX protease family)
LIQPLLVVSIVEMLIIVSVVMCRIGKLHIRDLGIDLSRLFTGAMAVLSVWLLSAGAGMLIGLGVRGSLFLDDWWYEHSATYIVGLLLCRLFGGTLKEELIFRGFLLNQLFLKLRSHFPVGSKKPLSLTLLISQVFFALAHIPYQLRKRLPLRNYPMQMVCLFAHGVGFAFIYHARRTARPQGIHPPDPPLSGAGGVVARIHHEKDI